MAKEYTKEIATELSKLNERLRRIEKAIAESSIQRQFHELPPPPQGQVYQNMLGTVVINRFDFERLTKNSGTEVTE